MPKPNKTYWQKYDLLYKNHSKKSIYKMLKRQSKKQGLPYKKEDPRGRKLKFSPYDYTSFICLQKIFGHRYREMGLEANLYLPDKADHSTFARNYAKIPEEYIEFLITSFIEKEFSYWIADSTCMSTKVKVERTLKGMRNKVLLRDKYHVIIGYDPPTNSTMILGVKATDEHVSDSKGAIEIIKGKQSHAYFLGDSAYNTYELHEVVKCAGLFPLMKPDKKGIRKPMSIKASNLKLFSKKIYKEIRGIVETVFGGATNAGLILTYAKKVHTRRLDTLMLALRHNLMASIRLGFIYLLFLCDKLSALESFIKENMLLMNNNNLV